MMQKLVSGKLRRHLQGFGLPSIRPQTVERDS
jgi:hypothetical protein